MPSRSERLRGYPLYAIGELDADGELDLVPAGDARPLFAGREVAVWVAEELKASSDDVCVLRAGDAQLPVDAVVEEIRAGLEATLRARAQAHDPALLGEVASRLSGYTDARLPQ